MKHLDTYILEKLKLNKGSSFININSTLISIQDIIIDVFSKVYPNLKYDASILNIDKHSLYTRRDWGDDNFVRLKILSTISKEKFDVLYNFLYKHTENDMIAIRRGEFFQANTKNKVKYIDYLIKK